MYAALLEDQLGKSTKIGGIFNEAMAFLLGIFYTNALAYSSRQHVAKLESCPTRPQPKLIFPSYLSLSECGILKIPCCNC